MTNVTDWSRMSQTDGTVETWSLLPIGKISRFRFDDSAPFDSSASSKGGAPCNGRALSNRSTLSDGSVLPDGNTPSQDVAPSGNACGVDLTSVTWGSRGIGSTISVGLMLE